MVITARWGTCSEVSFTAYKKINDVESPTYSLLSKTMLLHIDGFGYFVIQDYEETYEDRVNSKSITAYSAEYLLNNKSVNLTFVTTAGDINNTESTTVVTSNYFFYSGLFHEKSLLHQLLAVAPQWKIGYVSPSLMLKSRSFSETNSGLYGFLTNEVAQSYDALFVFDNEEYTINAYDTKEVIKNTNIVLSFDNLLKNATVSELSDDIYTVLNVTGAEDLDIRKVNPNGTNKLYCLDYYTGVLDKNADNYYENYNRWIKDNALKKKILDWEKECKEAIFSPDEESYFYWVNLYTKFNSALIEAQAELKTMQQYHDIAQKNMTTYSDYPYASEIKVQFRCVKALWPGDIGRTRWESYEWITVGDRSDRWVINDDSALRENTTDETYSVTWYQYWRNYATALEQNIKKIKTSFITEGVRNLTLYVFNKSDFGENGIEGTLNEYYNRTSFWQRKGWFTRKLITPTGEKYKTGVINHLYPPVDADKYTIGALEEELDHIQKKMDETHRDFSYDSKFTAKEKKVIEPYLIEGSFNDDSFIVTDNMKTKDYSDKDTKIQVVDSNGNILVKTIGELKNTDTIMDDFYMAKQLAEAGYEKLESVSHPSFSFSLESSNFLFIEKFQPFIDQLLSIEKNKGSLFGSVINVMLEDGNWVYPYLQEMSIEYDDPDNFTMSFGNRFRISDSTFTFNELHTPMIGAVSRTGKLLSAVSQPVTNGTISSLSSYTKSPIDLTKQTINDFKSSFNIGLYGISGRASAPQSQIQTFDLDEDDETISREEFSPEQISISNNKICFTTDYWETTKAIFGKMTTEDGEEVYGLKADVLIGSFVIGNNLIISNNNDTMTMDENGFIVKNDSMAVRIDPNEENVFNIYKRKTIEATEEHPEYEERTSVLTVARDGTLTITGGDLIVGDGTNGYLIDGQKGTIESVQKDKDGRPLFQLTPDGQLFTSGTTIDGSEILEPSPVVDPTGQNGVVDSQVIEMPSAFMDRLKVIAKAEWYGPYNYILDRVGKSDDEGWRNIWKYYSSRTIPKMLSDINGAGYHIVYKDAMNTAISDNNKILDNKYAEKSVLNSYQPKSDMGNYYSKSDINNILGISSTTTTQWKTITVGEEQITVLTKTN